MAAGLKFTASQPNYLIGAYVAPAFLRLKSIINYQLSIINYQLI